VPDDNATANLNVFIVLGMNDCEILDIGVFAHLDSCDIAAHDASVPDGNSTSQFHLSDNGGVVCEKGRS
jgi:hypothetical protein